MIEHPGLYVIVNLTTEEEIIISVGGKAPMLKVISAMKLNDFANGEVRNDIELARKIESNPSAYAYCKLESKYAYKEKKPIEEIPLVQKVLSKLGDKKEELDKFIAEHKDNEAIIFVSSNTEFEYVLAKEFITQYRNSLKP